MATQAILLEWGMPIEGRESKALEEFMSAVAWFAELQGSGRIESFSTYGTLTGDIMTRTGMAMVQGSQAQIDELRHSEDYRIRINRIANIAHNICLNLLETGDDMTKRMQRYGQVTKEMLG